MIPNRLFFLVCSSFTGFGGSLRPARLVSGSWFAGLLLAGLLLAGVYGVCPQHAAGQSSALSVDFGKAVAAGEFAVVKSQLPPSLQRGDRDGMLAQVAAAQSRSGDSLGAAQTMRGIESSEARRSVTDQSSASGQYGGIGGGGAFADFDSLMTLIETTVVPDTWEALGGNSTMAPYPQGIFVDAKGTIEVLPIPEGEKSSARGSLSNVRQLLRAESDAAAADWRAASPMRCVSIRRLRDEISSRRITGLPLGDSVLNLAGLSKVQYIMLTEDDVILAGPVGGIDVDRGWYIDRESGRTTLRSDFLARCLVASFSDTPFGCTIDPTPAGLQSAMTVAASIRSGAIPIGQSAAKLRDALGMQRVEVFGAAGDTAVALMMVEADRHMKQLALGERPMPDGVKNYLDFVDEMIQQGPPDGMLLRLWFTANPQTVRCDDEKRVFELEGNPIRLSGENQRALANGARGDVTVDPRSVKFVEEFNRNWTSIRDRYPVYGSLESLYRTAAVAHLINRYGQPDTHHQLALTLSSEDESQDWILVAPNQVESIATLHTVRSGGKRHHVLLASGGVSVDASEMVKPNPASYPALAGHSSTATQRRPIRIDRWWWDAH